MPSSRTNMLAVLSLALSLCLACSRGPGVPTNDDGTRNGSQTVPFDRESPRSRIPSSDSAGARLHEGSSIAIRLLTPVSSASSHAGDTFEATLDEPIVVAGQTAVPRGATVVGRVLAAKAAGPSHNPGYLRIALVNLALDGKRVAIETSSLFVKGGPHGQRDRAQPGTNAFVAGGKNEVGFDAERRLTFRLAQAVDLP